MKLSQISNNHNRHNDNPNHSRERERERDRNNATLNSNATNNISHQLLQQPLQNVMSTTNSAKS